MSPAELLEHIWEVFRRYEPTVRNETPVGLGEVLGDRFYLKYLVDSDGNFFVLEILDKSLPECWQLCISPTPGNRFVVSVKTVWIGNTAAGAESSALTEIWKDIFLEIVCDEPYIPKSDPHFMALVGAAVSPNGIISTSDDAAQVATLTNDLNYWRDLAKTQGRQLRAIAAPVRETTPEEAGNPSAGSQLATPAKAWRLDELEEWSAAHSDQIVILPRAISAAKRSSFEDPALVYDCLEMLATIYPKVKSGEADRHAFKRRADELGLNIGGSVDPSNAGERGDQYFVRWAGRRRFLDQHISKGSSRDPRFAMRIYFTYCEESKAVVVGWLPSHLGTGRT